MSVCIETAHHKRTQSYSLGYHYMLSQIKDCNIFGRYTKAVRGRLLLNKNLFPV